ncbi:hypothetical protein BDZ91DRAFT_683631, partial [Kalaharituber pfeilii]
MRPAPAPARIRPLLYHLPLSRTTYTRASQIQDLFVSHHLHRKRRLSSPKSILTSTSQPTITKILRPLPPIVITSEFHPPTYTTGLRTSHPSIPTKAQRDFLTSTPHPVTGERAELIETKRGGLITWHGPGQVTVYVVADLAALGSSSSGSPRGPSRTGTGMGVKDWVCALEQTTINTLSRYGIPSGRDPVHPGIWVRDSSSPDLPPDRKIAAVGVQARRWVTAHGVGLNVDTDPWWWGRIVACGIEGRGVASIREEMERLGLLG